MRKTDVYHGYDKYNMFLPVDSFVVRNGAGVQKSMEGKVAAMPYLDRVCVDLAGLFLLIHRLML